MNILQICYKYPPFFSGYGKQLETVNKKIIEEDKDKSITVLTCYGNKDSNIYYQNRIKIKSLFKSKTEGGKVHYYIFSIFIAFRFLLSFWKADVIHIIKAGPELIIPTAIAKLFGKKVIIKVAQDDLENLLPERLSFLRRIRLYFLRKTDAIVVLSKKIADEARSIKIEENKLKYIPNCVNFNRFNFEKGNNGKLSKNGKKYIFVGAISKRKGILDLLLALEQYNGEKILFSFIGPLYDVDYFNNRLNLINSKGYIDIEYYGSVNDPERFLKKHDCLILPSYNEGMPNVALEAMACGLYLLLSNISVHSELCLIAQGKTFELSNVESILSEILRFNSLPYTQDNKIAQYEIAKNTYSDTVVSQLYIQLYNNICH